MSKLSLQPETVLQRNPVLFSNLIDREVVIFDEEQSAYFGMNPVGSQIWNFLNEPLTLKALLKKLQTAFDVAETQCREDVLPFLERMIEKKLIRIAESTA